MEDIKIPRIGTRVEVLCQYSIPWMNEHVRPLVGIVSVSNPWDKPGTFRLTQVDNCIDESVIAVKNVKSMIILGTSREPNNPEAGAPLEESRDAKVFEVEGSKGNVYTVTIAGDQATCTCVAGSFGRDCKHIKQIRQREGLAV
jgi:hypothetical protein